METGRAKREIGQPAAAIFSIFEEPVRGVYMLVGYM